MAAESRLDLTRFDSVSPQFRLNFTNCFISLVTFMRISFLQSSSSYFVKIFTQSIYINQKINEMIAENQHTYTHIHSLNSNKILKQNNGILRGQAKNKKKNNK